MTTPTIESIAINSKPTHYAHTPCGTHRPLIFGGRGLNRDITKGKSFTAVKQKFYGAFTAEAKEFGVDLGICYNHPMGRELPSIHIPDTPMWTTMKSTSFWSALTSKKWKWLPVAFGMAVEGEEDRTLVYMGGNPSEVTFALAAIDGLVSRGIGFAFDGTSLQKNTPLIDDIRSAHENGRRVFVEANRVQLKSPFLPYIANAKLVGRRGSFSLKSSPKGSIIWFPQGVNSGREIAVLKEAVREGFGTDINYHKTGDTGMVFKILGGK